MEKAASDTLIAMVMDMMEDEKTDKGRLVRTLFFCCCIIAISSNVDLEKLLKILEMMYNRSSVALGRSSIFPPGEA